MSAAPRRHPVVIFVRCVVCAAEARMRHVERAHYVDPVGWLTIAAAFWPVGAPEIGTLHLRVCASCAGKLTPAA